jgi:hypothetical protein
MGIVDFSPSGKGFAPMYHLEREGSISGALRNASQQ